MSKRKSLMYVRKSHTYEETILIYSGKDTYDCETLVEKICMIVRRYR